MTSDVFQTAGEENTAIRNPRPTIVFGLACCTSAVVVSAMAGEQVIPRPPGPVTSQTPSRTCWRWTTRAVSVHWAYTPAQRRLTFDDM